MEKADRNFIVFCIGVAVSLVITCVVAFFIGRANQRANDGAGTELDAAADLNREIGDEQRRASDLNQRAIEFVERVRGITEETDSALGELGVLNRRSSDLPALIRAEANLLADYFRDISDELSNYTDHMGSE